MSDDDRKEVKRIATAEAGCAYWLALLAVLILAGATMSKIGTLEHEVKTLKEQLAKP